MHKLLLHLISDNNDNKILFGSSNCIAIMLVNILQGSNLFLNCKGILLNPRIYLMYVKLVYIRIYTDVSKPIFEATAILCWMATELCNRIFKYDQKDYAKVKG